MLSQYFKNRYGIQGLVVKAGYSLMYSMSNFFYDSDIERTCLARPDVPEPCFSHHRLLLAQSSPLR